MKLLKIFLELWPWWVLNTWLGFGFLPLLMHGGATAYFHSMFTPGTRAHANVHLAFVIGTIGAFLSAQGRYDSEKRNPEAAAAAARSNREARPYRLGGAALGTVCGVGWCVFKAVHPLDSVRVVITAFVAAEVGIVLGVLVFHLRAWWRKKATSQATGNQDVNDERAGNWPPYKTPKRR